jgi:hypothetical protein
MKRISSAYRWACFATVLGILLGSAYPAAAGKGNSLALDVKLDPVSLKVVDSPVLREGPFHVAGTIFKPGTDRVIGEFHCWGFIIDGGRRTAVSQEYNLRRRGKIEVQGVGGDGPQAITGGTGRFRNVRGEVSGINPCIVTHPISVVTVKVRLIGAGSGKKEKKNK